MRNMSFALTTDQIRNKTNTVTRRFGWWFLHPGDQIRPVLKGMGLKKGETIQTLLPDGQCIQVVSGRSEPLNAITKADCILEGFPDMQPADFIAMLVKHYRCDPAAKVNRIEFKYIDEGQEEREYDNGRNNIQR